MSTQANGVSRAAMIHPRTNYILELINIAQRELRVLLDLARNGAYLEQQRRTYAAAHHVLLRHESHLRAEMAAMGMPTDSAGREMVEAASSLRALILHAGLPHPDAVANAAGAPPANAGPVAQGIVHRQQPVPQPTVPQRAGAFVVPRSTANHQDATTTRQSQPQGNSHTIDEEPLVAERANSEGSDWEPESDDEDEDSDEQSSEDENGNGEEGAQSRYNSDSNSSLGSDSDSSSEDSEEWAGDDDE